MMLEDKITAAVIGPIKAGKGLFIGKMFEPTRQQIILDKVLTGNYWVPRKMVSIEEKVDNEFLQRYYADPRQHAFELQMRCMALRLEQQSKVDAEEGLVFTGQPLEVDRLFAEINRENIGDAFSTYQALFKEIRTRIT